MSFNVNDAVKAAKEIKSNDEGRKIAVGTRGKVTAVTGPIFVLNQVKFEGFAKEVVVDDTAIAAA